MKKFILLLPIVLLFTACTNVGEAKTMFKSQYSQTCIDYALPRDNSSIISMEELSIYFTLLENCKTRELISSKHD